MSDSVDNREIPARASERPVLDAFDIFAQQNRLAANRSDGTKIDATDVLAAKKDFKVGGPRLPAVRPDVIMPPVFKAIGRSDLLTDPSTLKPKVPTVAVLDVYDFRSESPNGKRNPGLSHGETSAAAAEARGYNVLRVNMARVREMNSGSFDYTPSLKALDEAIDSGDFPLKRGDAINLSMVASEGVTYESASRMLGMKITPENIAANCDKMIERMREIADDPQQTDRRRNLMKFALAHNDIIEKLQSRGIEFIHSSGNDGKNLFHWEFLRAKTQLTANDPEGKTYDWSTSSSLTTRAIGGYEIFYHQMNLLEKKPIAEQKGTYSFGTLPVHFPAEKFGGIHRVMNFQKLNKEGIGVDAKPTYNKISSEILFSKSAQNATSFAHQDPFPDKLTMPKMRKVSVGKGALAYPYDTPVAAFAGTSFSNVDYLWREFERLKRMKLE